MSRLATVRAHLAEAGADAAFVTHPPHVRWLTGFTGSNALVLVTPDAADVVTDGRYAEQAASEVAAGTEGAASVHVAPSALAEHAASLGRVAPGARVVFDATRTTVAQHARWTALWPDARFDGQEAWLDPMVAVKDAAGVAAMRRGQEATVGILTGMLRWLAPGLTEREVAARLVREHLEAGASAMAFDPIVASGPNGARPHARPTDRRLAEGELVVIDVGGDWGGACSDCTWTVALGAPNPQAVADHAAVARAHDAGVAALRAGVSGAEADRAARDVLAAEGLAEFFAHSLGHGVGAEVHEWPRLSQQADHRLPAGATVTVEPGVYRPGRWGIRTESLVLVTDAGAEVLAPFPTGLVVV